MYENSRIYFEEYNLENFENAKIMYAINDLVRQGKFLIKN